MDFIVHGWMTWYIQNYLKHAHTPFTMVLISEVLNALEKYLRKDIGRPNGNLCDILAYSGIYTWPQTTADRGSQEGLPAGRDTKAR